MRSLRAWLVVLLFALVELRVAALVDPLSIPALVGGS